MYSLELPPRSMERVVLESLSWTVLAAAGFLGNIIVCVAFIRNPFLRKLTPVYIIALAISDILNFFTNGVFVGVTLVTGSWQFGAAGCFVCGFFVIFLMYVSICTMSLTAVNRCIRVIKPELFQTIFTPKRSIVIVVCLWLVVAISVLLPSASGASEFAFHVGYAVCVPSFEEKFPVYTMITHVSFITASLIIVPACYYKVYRALKEVQLQVPQVAQNSQAAHQPKKPQFENQPDETEAANQPQDSQLAQQPQAAHQQQEQQVGNQQLDPQTTHQPQDPQAPHQPQEQQAGNQLLEPQNTHQPQDPQAAHQPQEPQTAHQPLEAQWEQEPSSNFRVFRVLRKTQLQELQAVQQPQESHALQQQESQADHEPQDPQAANQPQQPQAVHQEQEAQAAHQAQQPQAAHQAQEAQTAQHGEAVMRAKEAKFTKMIFVTVLVFYLLWIPISVIIIVTRVSFGTIPRDVTMLVSYAANVSGLINPVLYATMNRSYRHEFKDIFRRIMFYFRECCIVY